MAYLRVLLISIVTIAFALFVVGFVYLTNQGLNVTGGIMNVLRAHPEPVTANPHLEKLENYQVTWLANILDYNIDESSGLAMSTRMPGRLWTINDSGSEPVLYALNLEGETTGSYRLDVEQMFDWEALDAYVYEGRSMLLVADTGDNFRFRESVWLHLLKEPGGEGQDQPDSLSPVSSIEVLYPDGPRDCEAVAVDTKRQRILLLSKRHQPPELFEIPLHTTGKVTARKIAEFSSLPRATVEDFDRFPVLAPYVNMPTGMDVHGDKLLVTTYEHAFLYDLASLRDPVQIDMPRIGQREAIAFSQSGNSAYVTRERTKEGYEAEIFEIKFDEPDDAQDTPAVELGAQ